MLHSDSNFSLSWDKENFLESTQIFDDNLNNSIDSLSQRNNEARDIIDDILSSKVFAPISSIPKKSIKSISRSTKMSFGKTKQNDRSTSSFKFNILKKIKSVRKKTKKDKLDSINDLNNQILKERYFDHKLLTVAKTLKLFITNTILFVFFFILAKFFLEF